MSLGKIRPLTTFPTGDPAFDRYQQHVKQTLGPVLQNPLLGAVDFRWNEIPGVPPANPTFALQYRSGSTWNTIVSCDSSGILVQPAWTSLTLAGTWVSNGLLPPGYFKDAIGFVHLRGNVTGGGADLITTLPAGYRPSARGIWATDHNGTYGRINVMSDGTVTSDVGANPHTNVALEGVMFDTGS